ncbi:MAG: 30S ribosome-binding factor RbfA [Planctomycetota bacterium]
MPSRRVLKAAEAIREVVSMAILTDLRDPRVQGVTVTYVEVSGDLRNAKVHVSIMGDEAEQRLCLHGLKSSAGFLQSKVGDRIDTRYTPKLEFKLDMGVKNSIAIAKTLNEVLGETQDSGGTNDPEEDPAPVEATQGAELMEAPEEAPTRDDTTT